MSLFLPVLSQVKANNSVTAEDIPFSTLEWSPVFFHPLLKLITLIIGKKTPNILFLSEGCTEHLSLLHIIYYLLCVELSKDLFHFPHF